MTPKQLETEIKSLIAHGKIVEAVQLVIKIKKCGLREAKNFVDQFR